MIATYLVERVKQLLAEGKLSHRKIARLSGVNRGTIGAIASGKRRIPPKQTNPWDEEPPASDVPPERCPKCGRMVYMPCRACRVKNVKDKSPKQAVSNLSNERQPMLRLELDLKPVHRQRYEEVRRWRRDGEGSQPVEKGRHDQPSVGARLVQQCSG